jgi:hypothetical protein
MTGNAPLGPPSMPSESSAQNVESLAGELKRLKNEENKSMLRLSMSV